MLLHGDVIRSWHRKLAMETQAQTMAVGTGFGGKIEHLERFIDSLVDGHGGGERAVADPDAVIAHGTALLEDEDGGAVEREAEIMARFARVHGAGKGAS